MEKLTANPLIKAKIEYNQADQSWSASWGTFQWCIRMEDGQLLAEHLSQGSPREAWTHPPHYSLPPGLHRGECFVRLGNDEQEVIWELSYWSIRGSILDIGLTSERIQAKLTYEFIPELDFIRKSTHLTNCSAEPIRLWEANSFAVSIPQGESQLQLTYLGGQWGRECQMHRTVLGPHQVILQSRQGKTGFDIAPWFAVEGTNETWLGILEWSGDWRIQASVPYNRLSGIMGGLQTQGLQQFVQPGASFSLPTAIFGCVSGDLNLSVQKLHDYQRRLRPDPDRPIPVQFNSWYPFQGEPNEAEQLILAEHAARLGCEIFVLDAGWYTTMVENPEESWMDRTGDWVINKKLFPQGLEPLRNHCQGLGIQFGIWMEPETVGPSSWIARNKPEWCFPSITYRRTVNLGIPEAREWVKARIFDVLTTSKADWLKWDFNVNVYPHGKALPDGNDALVAHILGLYQLMDEVRQAFPRLTLEMCAGGGGRFDTAIISRSHTNWMSDQVNPIKNLAIHFGSQLAHCAVSCNDWLICWPPKHNYGHDDTLFLVGDLTFRTHVAMLGSFGISSATRFWQEEDFECVAELVRVYKEHIRKLVHHGDMYRLTNQPPLDGDSDWAAMWYASKDAAYGALFAFRLGNGQAARSFRLPGMSEDGDYLVERVGHEGNNIREIRSGRDLYADGIEISLPAPFRSMLILISVHL